MLNKARLKKWQLWVHYVLLEFVIMFWLKLSLNIGELIVLFLVLAVGDQIIHYLLFKLTGWKD